MRENPFTIVDLFCGAGGMSEGFKQAGFEVLLGIESDATAAATYQKNNPTTPVLVKDIQQVSAEDILRQVKNRKVDVVVGGPPCQGFSTANTLRKMNDPRNGLYLEFIRIVKALNPDFFVMENVRGFVSAKTKSGKLILEDVREQLDQYEVEHRVLLVADYGVPQMRRRAFVIGRRGKGPMPFPKKTHFKNVEKQGSVNSGKKWVSVRRIIKSKRRASRRLFYSKKLIDGFRKREKSNKKNGLGFRWQFLDMDKPSYTIPARYYKDGANALVRYSDSRIRMLDIGECATIQSFPSDYIFLGSRRQVYQQIGNAVPPLMSRCIAEAISMVLEC